MNSETASYSEITAAVCDCECSGKPSGGEDKRHEALEGFSQMTAADDATDMGDNIKLIGRWHDLVGFTGVAICETSDPTAVHKWLLNWNSIINVEVRPVLDDEETRAIGRARLADA